MGVSNVYQSTAKTSNTVYVIRNMETLIRCFQGPPEV